MSTRTKDKIMRLAALVLATCAASGAWADRIWTGDDNGDWWSSANWNGSDGNWCLNYTKPNAIITFSKSDDIATGVWVENTISGNAVFTASDDCGINMTGTGDFHIGGWGDNGVLTINGGTYYLANDLYVGYEHNWWKYDSETQTDDLTKDGFTVKGYLTINRGSVEVKNSVVIANWADSIAGVYVNGGVLATQTIVKGGGSGELSVNGGSLRATAAGEFIGSGLTVTVGENDGTIDTAGHAVTIASAITGSGTLRITGGGSVTFSADPTCPILAVAGTTVLNSSGARIGYNTWQGADGDYWNDASNWSLGVVPTPDQIVEINDDHTIKISGWNETDADACKVGALVVNGNVTFANAWKRLLVYGASGETAISGKGTLTLTSNTGLENYSSTGIQDITCGLAFGANDNHAWLGGSTYGWRVIGTTTLNCAMQTDKPVTFSGAIVSSAGRINTQAQAVTITSSSITGTSLEINHASDSTAGSVSFATAPSCPLYVNGGETVSGNIGDVTFASGHTLTLSGNTVNASSITSSGSLTVTGYGDITVSGAVNVTGTLDFSLNNFVDLKESIVDTYTINLSAQSVNAGNITGIANITTTDGVTANSAAFYGSIKGTGGVATSGTTVLYGLNDFSGTLSVGQNASVEIVSSLEGISPTWRLDALEGETETLEFTDGKVTKWTAQGETCYFSNADSPMTTTTDYFGGRRAVLTNYGTLTASFTDIKNMHPTALIGAVRLVAYNSGAILYDQNAKNYYIGRRSNLTRWCKMENSRQEYYAGFWANGVYGMTPFDTTTDKTLSILDFTRSGNTTVEYLGGSEGNIAIGELVAFNSNPSHQAVKRVETYLANKWGISGKSLPSVPVVLGAGSVLDLGGTSQTLASLSVSGTGTATVQNGSLTVTAAISLSDGQVLVLPAGTAYTLADASSVNVSVEDGTGVITLSRGEASVGDTFYETAQAAIDALLSGEATGTLTIYRSAEVSIPGELSGITVVCMNNAELTFAAVAPYTATITDGTLNSVRNAATYKYVGTSGNASLLNASGNYTLNGDPTTLTPTAIDTLQIDGAFAFTQNAEVSVGTISIGENSSITVSGGSSSNLLRANSITGKGQLILGNGAWVASSTSTATFGCEVVVSAENAANAANMYVTDTGREITLTGVLSGSGYLKCRRGRNKADYSGTTLDCSDTARFSGTIESIHPANGDSSKDIGRNYLTICKNCDLSKATVILATTREGNYGSVFINTGNEYVERTYKFGSLSGYIYEKASDGRDGYHQTIEVGALGKNDEITGGCWKNNSSRNPYIKKVGNGTFTTYATGAYGYILNGGALVVKSTDTTACTTECANAIVRMETDTEAGTTTYTLEAVASKEVSAASAEAAVADATVNITAAQAEAGVVPGYYKVVATPAETDGTYALTVEFADEVVPAVSEENVTSDAVSFSVSNFKKGLYYGVASGTSPDPAASGTALTQCENEGTGVSLTADMPENGVKYYKVVVSDTAQTE